MTEKILKEIIRNFWLNGDLEYKLKPHQINLYNSIKNSTTLKYVVNCSRRFGKSFVLILIAIEYAYKNKNSNIRLAAPSQKQLKEITIPIFNKIIKDCPQSLKPIYKVQDSHYYIPITNSFIHIAGCNEGGMENLRGHESHLNVIDEAGSIVELQYVLKDILIPQTLTTFGKTYIASTPPRTPSHYFNELCQGAKVHSYYSIYNIYDNTSLSKETIELYCKESGGVNSTTWKREYLCQFVVDENIVVIPEWKEDYIQEIEKTEYYKFYQHYQSMDIGGRDKTAILYGYYDFKRNKLIIEHESIFTGQNTTTKYISETIKDIEYKYYPNKIWKRYADNNNIIMLQDLAIEYNVRFVATSKDRLRGNDILDGSMVNETRLFIDAGNLIVHPRCTELIGCLSSAIWDIQRKKFERSNQYGHYDALAALIYMIKNIDLQNNPIPVLYGVDIQNTHFERISNNNLLSIVGR